jgi:peroxin-16
VYSLLNILGIYHDSILHRTTASLPTPVRPSPSSHARYTRYWTSTSPTYAVLARSLTVLSHLELLLEMALRKRKGQEAGDQAVLVIESVKAVLRLALLGTTGGRGGVQPPIAEREVDPTLLDLHRPVAGSTTPVVPRVLSTEGPPPRSAADVLLGPIGGGVVADEEAAAGGAEEEMSHRDYWKGPRTGLTRPTIASIRGNAEPMVGDATASSTGGKESVQQYLLTRVLTVEDVRRDQDLVNKTMGLKKLAEIIWIMRPLLYGPSLSPSPPTEPH